MNMKPDSDPDLEEDDIPDASELLDFELIAKSQPDKGQGLWLWLVLVLVLAGGGWAGWMYLQGGEEEVVSADGVPVIQSPAFDLKQKPTDPGGMKVPDRDKLVYDRMSGEGTQAADGVERLLPPPETPIEPPKAPEKAAEKAAEPAMEQAAVPPPAPAALTPKEQPQPPSAPAPAPVPEAAAPTAPPEPAAPPKVEAKPEPKPAYMATAPAGQGYLVQLSAVRTEQAAAAEWKRLATKHPDVLGGLDSVIQRADLGDRGIFYRVRAGWFTSRTEAKAVCDELARRNVGCIIAKP